MSEPATEETPEVDIDVVEMSEQDREFFERRAQIAERLKDDETFRLCIAEIWMSLNQMDQAVRAFAMQGGVKGIMKMMFGKGSKEKEPETE